jgi:hypothetical protein
MSQPNQSDLFSSKILNLKFTIGTWRSSNRLTLENGVIKINNPPAWVDEEASFSHAPSDKEWLDFSKSLDRLDVVNWKERYMDPSILDGTQWNLLVVTDSFEIDTGGSNAYPENFDEFIKTINRLISEEYFTLDYNRTTRYISG